MIKFFKAIGNFLYACEEYFDFRIRTGKFVGDIKNLSDESKETSEKKSHIYLHRFIKSRFTRALMSIIVPVYQKFLLIPFMREGVDLIIDAAVLIKNHYVAIFIIFSITLPSFIALYYFFNNSPIPFSLWLFPVLLYNLVCFSALYGFINKNAKGEKKTLLSSFFSSLRSIASPMTLLFAHVFTVILLAILFCIFALFLSYFYDLINAGWTDSFLYWYLVIFALFATMLSIFVFNIIFYQSYFFSILDKNNFSLSFRKSSALLEKHLIKFLFFSFVFNIFFFYAVYWATITYFPGGLVVSIFSFSFGGMFFHFLMRRKFLDVNLPPDQNTKPKNIFFITSFFIVGFITYVLITALTVRQYQDIISFIDVIQKQSYAKQQLVPYVNIEDKYTISYPRAWNLQEKKENLITFYKNYNETITGGIWLTIKISPLAEADFDKLYNIRPGIIQYDTLVKDLTTKISTFSVQEHKGVKYTYFKAGIMDEEGNIPPNIYEIRYLVVKDNKEYEVAFKTLDKNVEGENAELFESIIKSFRFTK